MALTRKGTVFAWTTERQDAFDKLKSCLLRAPIFGSPTEADWFVLDTDASLFAVGGVLNQIQGDWEVVITYASWNLWQFQCRYCTTCREMFAAVTMCNHFRTYLRGAQITLRTDHQSLQWLQKFCNSDSMLTRWYMILRQFSVTFKYRPGSQPANADGLSCQCGQCLRPDCPVGPPDLVVIETSSTSDLAEQPFAASAMGDSMDTDLLELSGETWVATIHLDESTGDLPLPDSDPDLIASSLMDNCTGLGTGRDASGLVGLCWAVPRTPFVAPPVGQFIHRFRRSTLASPRTSDDSATARGTAGPGCAQTETFI